jgi:hypothetical protein
MDSGECLDQIRKWLDANCGADGWAMAPADLQAVMNDAIAIYLSDATLAGGFVARWCAGYKIDSANGVFQMGEDSPAPRGLPVKTP